MTITEMKEALKSLDLVLETIGLENTSFQRVMAIEDGGPGDLVCVDKAEYLPKVKERRPTVVVTSAALKEACREIQGATVVVVSNVGLAHAFIKQKYGDRDFSETGWTKIHPSAVIHESATIDTGTVVEPRVVIGKNSKIGKNCRLMAGVVLENDVTIGDATIIHPLVVIGYGCRIGNQVDIGSGSVIGSEGYGFAQDKNRRSFAIPQTGIVVIEDRVRVGANNCIDRAAYRQTRIGAGTKLDNFCHIAHNVNIGEDCLLTAMLCIAGSATVGDRVIASGQTGILDHVTICNDVVLLHRAGVSKDIDKPGAYGGAPAIPLNDYMRNAAVLKNAADLRKRVSDLEKKGERT